MLILCTAVWCLLCYQLFGEIKLIINNNNNKKYVLWNTGICPIASKVGHVTRDLGHAPFGVIHRRLCVACHGLSNKEKTKSLASSV